MPRRRSPADRERDSQAVHLRRRGVAYEQIANQLGYRSRSSAYEAVSRAIRDGSREAINEVRQIELGKLDDAERRAWVALARVNILVSQGRVMTSPDTGDPLVDDMPNLHALDRLLKIAERRARLLGLDAPVRAKVEVEDGLDAQIEKLITELERTGSGSETTPEGSPDSRTRRQKAIRAAPLAVESTPETTPARRPAPPPA